VSRLRRIADHDRIFFVTTNLSPKTSPLTSAERDLILQQLSRQRADRDFRLFGYVVMPTHLHILFAPDRLGLVDTVHRLKRFSGAEIRTRRKLSKPIWQPRFYDFVLRRVHHFWEKLDYIHENPVAAKLVPRSVDWRWSSARQYSSNRPQEEIDGLRLRVDRIDLRQDRDALLNPVW
jgi:putative transposase